MTSLRRDISAAKVENARNLPRVAYGDPAAGARALVEVLTPLVTEAEALGALVVAARLGKALEIAKTLAAEGRSAKAGTCIG